MTEDERISRVKAILGNTREEETDTEIAERIVAALDALGDERVPDGTYGGAR
jgi:hypothetical protein